MAEQAWTVESALAADGYALGFRKYASAHPRGPVVACIHGIQSHSGWYDRGCRFLADSGFTTYFLDRRGSGVNAAERGHAKSHFQLIDDLRRTLAVLRESHPGKPLILLAISWGGKVGVATLADHSALADGLILVAPGFAPMVRPPFVDQVRIALSTFTRPRRLLPVPLSDPALFTGNPDWQQFIASDPLAVKQASARLLFSSRLLDFRLRRVAGRITHPTLLLLASEDRIIDNAQTRAFARRFASNDVEIVELQGAHTLEFERDPTVYFQALKNWIEKKFLRGDR
jgi:alpha-beta hydrolase superfamily lysophospholipase